MIFSSRDLRRLVLPLIGEQILLVAVGMADTMMVASVGESAVSGVALVDSISFLLLQIFGALSTGGAVIVSQLLGKRDFDKASDAAAQLVQITTIIATIVGVVSMILHNILLVSIFGNVEASVMQAARIYFIISAISYPFIGAYSSGAAMLRSIGATDISLYISIIMNIINVVGNAVLIYQFNMGVTGAALATLLARAVSSVLVVTYLRYRQHPITIKNKLLLKPQWKIIKNILYIGVPSGLENGMFQIGKLLVQKLVASFGTAAIAANAVAGNIVCIATIPGGAMSLALLSITGKCMGAGKPDEAKKDTLTLIFYTILSMGVLNLIVWFLVDSMLGIYNISQDAFMQAKQLIVWHCVISTLLYATSFCLPSALRGTGDVGFTMKASVVSMWIFRILGSYFIGGYLGLGLFGVWLATFADWIIRSLLFGIRFLQGKWKKIVVIK